MAFRFWEGEQGINMDGERRKTPQRNRAHHNAQPLFHHVRIRPASAQAVINSELRERVRQVVEQVAARYGFEAVVLSASGNYMQLILGLAADADLRAVVQWVKDETTRAIFVDWPVYRRIAPAGSFWEEGFIYTTHNAATIEAALDYVRQEGDVDLFGKPTP